MKVLIVLVLLLLICGCSISHDPMVIKNYTNKSAGFAPELKESNVRK